MARFDTSCCSEIASGSLLVLNGFKESLEVTGAEALVVSSLDDFNEESWTVLDGLCEDLQKIALLIVVDKNLLVLNDVDVFLDLEVDFADTLSKIVVIGVWNFVKELDSTGLHSLHSRDDIVCS